MQIRNGNILAYQQIEPTQLSMPKKQSTDKFLSAWCSVRLHGRHVSWNLVSCMDASGKLTATKVIKKTGWYGTPTQTKNCKNILISGV